MTADSLETLTVMEDLEELRDQADDNWDALGGHDGAAAFLVATAELDEVSSRIGELSRSDPRLLSLRDLAYARAVAAQTVARAEELEAAASLMAALSLASADPAMLAAARLFLAESALLLENREDAENLALSVRMAESELDATPVAGELLERIRDTRETQKAGDDEATGREPEELDVPLVDPQPTPAEELVDGAETLDDVPDVHAEEEETPLTVSWEDRVKEIAKRPFAEQCDGEWDQMIAEARDSLGSATDTSDLTALRHRLRELMLLITDNPSVSSPHLRPEVIGRAVDLHRLQQRVMEDLGDQIAARIGRNSFFQSFLAALKREIPSSVPLDDRILIVRYHLNLSTDVTGHDDEERSEYATQLAELYQGKNDHNGEIMAFLEKGSCLENLGRYAEMYDVYEQALNLSRRYRLDSGIIWSTIRLSYAHFLAKDPRTATQLLLDMDERLTEEQVRGVDEREAYAEAKVALANLFAQAGAVDGSQRYYKEAADLFTSIGNESRAWECTQKAID